MEIPAGYTGSKMKLWDQWLQKPNSTDAAMALDKLPLKNKPHAGITGWDKEAIRPWVLWYEQIKAGNRTFSFEGDPTDYNLNGPVREAKNPDANRTPRRPTTETSPATKASPEAKAANQTEDRSNLTTIVPGIIALILGSGYWIYRRKSSAS
jgi:hypothetical protein